jgi:hypothetical protein
MNYGEQCTGLSAIQQGVADKLHSEITEADCWNAEK